MSVSVAFVAVDFNKISLFQLSFRILFYFTWEEDLMCLCRASQWTVCSVLFHTPDGQLTATPPPRLASLCGSQRGQEMMVLVLSAPALVLSVVLICSEVLCLFLPSDFA